MIEKVFADTPAPTSILGGTINPPVALLEGGAVGFFNIILKIIFLAAGLYAFWNFIVAGYKYLSAGSNPEAVGEAWGIIWKSLLGLIIIVISFVFAALIGWLIFGDATAILNPKLTAVEN